MVAGCLYIRPMDDREHAEKGPVLPGWSLLASAALHGLGALILLLIAAIGFAPLPEQAVVRVTLLEDGAGAAGAAGGAEGGGGEQSATAGAPAAASEVPEAPAAKAPAVIEPPQQSASAPSPRPTPMRMPPPPHHKPQPPHRQLAAAPRPTAPVPHGPVPEKPEIARAPGPSAEVAAAGAGSGPGGPAGSGEGAQGTGAGSMGTDKGPGDDYLERVQRWIKRFQYYPEEADKQGQRGVVLLDIDIARDGTVLDVRIARGSGYPLLDAAAVQAVRNSSPVPPFPSQYQRERGTIEVSASYSQSLVRRLLGPG
jgi:protein TonB